MAAVSFPMATIERLSLESSGSGGERWDAIAAAIGAWARARGEDLRDAIVLLPFVQLLAPARRAFASLDGWPPRVETTQSLAAGLGPGAAADAGQLCFDPAIDALGAAALLRAQPWGAAWARRDARGFGQAAAALTTTAHALARAAFALPPTARAGHWAAARALLGPIGGPGETERRLARMSLEWAALAPEPATDRLFAGAAPVAWIAVRAGGADPLTEQLLAASAVHCLVIDMDGDSDGDADGTDAGPADDHAFARIAADHLPALALCDDFEHEAQCAAAQVLEHVRHGELPVALIAQDRVLVRRVRALLERHDVDLLDETGWTLSTTRAAAQLIGLLRAARPDAGIDALLDWLRGGTRWSDADTALAELERGCRSASITRVGALSHAALKPAAARLWADAAEILADLATPARRTLADWFAALAEALARAGALARLEADDAGRQALAALRRAASIHDVTLGADAFHDWVDGAFEQASFIPSITADVPPQVVITPLARAMLRPFAALVLPGADDKHLGATPPPDALLGDTLAGALGLPTVARRRRAERLAFVQALAVPRVTLLRRRSDGREPLAASPLVERLALAAPGGSLPAWRDPRIAQSLVPTPIRMSAPSAAALLPASLSASACEALRACPYRFHALYMLALREDDELEREIDKRDYGNWLHAVLLAFHAGRGEPASPEAERARLLQLGEAQRVAVGLGDAEFLPFAASFASFAPRYIEWLHRRDARGERWRAGEVSMNAAPAELGGTGMHGVIDRIDDVRFAGAAAVQLIDYKTGSSDGLKAKVKDPLEDTQLAFYAALMRGETALPLRASYLAVDGTKRIDEHEHPNVEDSAVALVTGLGHDLARLRAGAGLPALGEGATCDYCAARGICRRDHWTTTP